MHIRAQLSNDHAEIRSLGADILSSVGDDGPGGRDNQFGLFDRKLRRHLSAIEDAILLPLEKDRGCAQSVHDLEAQHKTIRRELGALDHDPKARAEWTGRFESLMADLEALASRHDALVALAEDTTGSDDESLAHRYTHVKLHRLHGRSRWARIGLGAGAVAGAVAAGAAVAAAARKWRGEGERGNGDLSFSLETDENLRLIASDKVEGTAVMGAGGEKLGRIERLMLDKYTGLVAYAVLSFGGMLGFGKHLFPVPWEVLDYDEDADGYVLDITGEQLEAAPRFEASDEPEFDPVYRRRVILFYRPAAT